MNPHGSLTAIHGPQHFRSNVLYHQLPHNFSSCIAYRSKKFLICSSQKLDLIDLGEKTNDYNGNTDSKFFSLNFSRAPKMKTHKNRAIINKTDLFEQKHKEDIPFSLNLNEGKALILLNVLAVGYALTAIMVKSMGGGDDMLFSSKSSLPLTSLEFTLRFGFASFLFAWPSITRHRARMRQKYTEEDMKEKREEMTNLFVSGIELGIWMFCTYAGQAIGLETSSANHAILLLTLSVVFVPFLESFFGKKISLKLWISAVMVCFGVVMLEGGVPAVGFPMTGDTSDWLVKGMPDGHAWCLLGALGSAIHVVRAEMLCSKLDSMSLLTIQMITTTLLSLFWFSFDISRCADVSSCGDVARALVCLPWPMIFMSGPVGTAMCEWLELEGLQFVSASKATLILMASPLWTSILAYFLLGETLDSSSAVGGFLILMASVQIQVLPHDGTR